MRNLDTIVAERIAKTGQTIADNANPAVYARLIRHTVPIGQKQFIERTIVKHVANITDSDVAVCHPRFLKDDEDIWVAYIASGTLHVRHCKNVEVLTNAVWTDYSIEKTATACSIAFNSTPRHNPQDIWEFVTDREPWVFWVDSGALKAQKCTPLGAMEIELAQANVTDVSAVRGPSGEQGNWNLGLTVFFVMGGSLYYRQYIDDVWYDAELIQFPALSGITISEIKAFNTWDYRVGVQILASDGKLYELYSYTEGIGTRGTEHLSMSVSAEGQLTGIEYHHEFFREHLEMSVSGNGQRIYGLSAVPVSAQNVNLEGNYGRVVEITMDYPCTAGQASEFVLEDSNGVLYSCEAVQCSGTVVRLTFIDFNYAYLATSATVHYTKGTLMSPAVLTNFFDVTFTPTGLVQPAVDPPEVDTIYNL